MTEQSSELRRELTELLKQIERASGRLRFVLDHLVEPEDARSDDSGTGNGNVRPGRDRALGADLVARFAPAFRIRYAVIRDWPIAGGNMDREEALKLLRGGAEGVKEWNRRRMKEKRFLNSPVCNLIGARLRGAEIDGIANYSSNCNNEY